MSKFNFNDCLKAMNKAEFRPTEYRKAKALELLQEAMVYVNGLGDSEPTPSKPQKKASTKTSSQNEKMLEMLQQMLSEGMTFNEMSHKERLAAGQESASYEADLDKPKAKAKPKKKASPKRSKAKVKKATAQQRVADRQEKLFHGKADSPVQPSKKAKKASVAKARKSAVQVSEATGATARAKAKQLAKAKAEAKELQKQLAATMEKLASLL